MKLKLPITCMFAASLSLPLHASSVALSSTMDASGTISEDSITGETFIISNGDGTVANGKLGDDDSNPGFGDLINLFPNEANFSVGSLTYDESLLSGTGMETIAVQTIDLSGLWSSDPNRTTSNPSDDATVLSDISDYAIGQWLFNNPGGITFGALDASDTLTFTDGQLTSIDLSITSVYSIDGLISWSGDFSITGDQISYQINDTQASPLGGTSTLVINLTGTVNAVPEPSSSLLIGLACLAGFMRRRR